jgi:hypothetical protein
MFDKESYKIGDRYSHSVLEVCSALHGAACGSGDDVPNETLEIMIAWLQWRTFDGWERPSKHTETYDDAVWTLCRTAIRECQDRLDFLKRRDGAVQVP